MIKKLLQEKVKLHKRMHWRLNGYYGPEDFVLKHGLRLGKSIPLPAGITKGKMGQCHYNSYFAALYNRRWLFYVEGFAYAKELLKPCLHAWTINKNLEVIDPTWGESKAEYYGVVIRIDYVTKWSLKNMGSSRILIDDLNNDYPLTREAKADWAETNFRNCPHV